MKLNVVKYFAPPQDYFECRDEKGFRCLVDLLVDGGLGNVAPQDLVGKTVEVGSLSPFLFVATDVKKLEEA